MRSLFKPFPAAMFALLVFSGCVSAPKPAPRPAPRPVPIVTPQPPAPAPLASDWRDWPYTPGDWTYRQDARGSIATFGTAGREGEFTIRCDLAANAVYVSRAGAAPAPMTIRTSTMLRTLNVQSTGAGAPAVTAAVGTRDSLLEAIAFSRGRFIVQQAGYPILVLPAWAEIGRVTEDCRR